MIGIDSAVITAIAAIDLDTKIKATEKISEKQKKETLLLKQIQAIAQPTYCICRHRG